MGHVESWDTSTLEVYAALARLRGEQAALRRGGLRWVHLGDDLVVFAREHPDGSVLVAASRGGSPEVTLPAGPLGLRDGSVLFATGTVAPGAIVPDADGAVTLPAYDRPGFVVWKL